MKQITAYQTEDGSVFATAEEAAAYDLTAFLKKYGPTDAGGEPLIRDPASVAATLVKNPALIIKTLRPCLGVQTRASESE